MVKLGLLNAEHRAEVHRREYECFECKALFAVFFRLSTDAFLNVVCCPVCKGDDLYEYRRDQGRIGQTNTANAGGTHSV